MTLRQLWFAANAWRGVVVRTPEELDAVLAKAPPWIVVEGSEALRAEAARLAYRGGVNGAGPVSPTGPVPESGYPAVPAVGRIRDGLRKRPVRGRSRFRLAPGFGPLLVAGLGLFAALLTEWLSFPADEPEMVHGKRPAIRPLGVQSLFAAPPPPPAPPKTDWLGRFAIPALVLIALAALVYVIWQASGIGRPVRIGWRVERRIQGRLVLARVKEAVLT